MFRVAVALNQTLSSLIYVSVPLWVLSRTAGGVPLIRCVPTSILTMKRTINASP